MIYGMLDAYESQAYTDTFADLRATAEAAIATLSQHEDEFDFIAVQGMSGVIIASPVAIAIGKPLVIIRKDDDYLGSSHTSNRIENRWAAFGRYVFLDDFISMGRTRTRVREALGELASYREPHEAITEVATYQYRDDWYTTV